LDALRKVSARGGAVALLVVDQRMPGMGWVDFLEQAIKLSPECRRILLTAYADTEATIKAINKVKTDYYLLKPWEPALPLMVLPDGAQLSNPDNATLASRIGLKTTAEREFYDLVIVGGGPGGGGVRGVGGPEAADGRARGIWTNLIDNALDALNGKGRLTVQTAHEADRVLVEIRDDGPGIPADIQGRIFEPFFTTKGIGEGTRLGLDAAYRIVAGHHHGDLRVASTPGDTRFQVRLPLGVAPPNELKGETYDVSPNPESVHTSQSDSGGHQAPDAQRL